MTVIEQRTMESFIDLNSKIPEITLRDLFACFAMNGFLSRDVHSNWDMSDIADLSYQQADFMLQKRKEK